MNADGSDVTKLTDQHFRSLDPPGFLRDGRILFAATTTRMVESCLYYVDVNAPDKLKAVLINAGQPAIREKDDDIVFMSDKVSRATPYDYEIWETKPEYFKLKQITTLQSLLQWPSFVGNSEQILAVSDPHRNGNFSLISVDLRTGINSVLYP
jgi:hypothetical protein